MTLAARNFFLAVSLLLGATGHCSAPEATDPPTDVCAIDPTSIVSDACASYSTLDALNTALQPQVYALTHSSDFFSYYRLNLYNKKCPFWNDETSICGNIACAVNTIEHEDDIPKIWRAEELGKLEGPKAQHPNRQLQQERPVKPLQGELGEGVGESCVVEYDDECDERDYCVPEDESAAAKGDYVSLVDNPERFTGYAGPGAHQVWEAIYRENCFFKDDPGSGGVSLPGHSPFGAQASADLRNVMRDHERLQALTDASAGAFTGDALELDDECVEKRTFYRVLSGMHASISTHLCYDYLNQTTGEWGPNVQCYQDRLHNHPERISNLYFNYALVLRAVAKARNALKDYTFCSGDPTQDRETKAKVLALADRISRGPTIYDESLLFQDPSVEGLKEDFRNRFRNVSRTMDCVGCDKCRLWGKVQTSGYGTALKILFEFDEHDQSNNPPLRRTELVALMNTLDKISHSLKAISEFHRLLEPHHPRSPTHSSAVPTSVQSERKSLFEEDGERDDFVEPPVTLWGEFKAEFNDIWITLKFILNSWAEIPQTCVNALVFYLDRLWNLWLGLPQKEWLRWEWREPPPRRSEL